MTAPIFNEQNIAFGINAIERFGKILDQIKYVTYLPHAYSLIKGLFYSAEALTLLAHRYIAPYLEESAKALYKEQTAPLKPYVIDYKKTFDVISLLAEKFYPEAQESLMMVKRHLIDSEILEEFAKEEDKPLATWVQELEQSDETVGSYRKTHPFASKAIVQLLKTNDFAQLDPIRLKTFTQAPNVKATLEVLKTVELSPAKLAQGITSWKWELEDPDNFQWLCTKIVLRTLLVLPLAYVGKETWSLVSRQTVFISSRSLMKQVFFTSLVAVGVENLSVRVLKTLDSRKQN